jgi:predicted nucleotidyltransferase
MALEEHSFRHLLPTFIISPGTQVVLKADKLRPLAQGCITRHYYHHYRGFIATQRKLLAKQEPKILKTLLYAYRVLLSGIHLLRTGEVEAFLPRLAQQHQRPFLHELIAQKREEKCPAADLDWAFHDAQLRGLDALLETAFQGSTLPDERDRRSVSAFLVRWRCDQPSSDAE